MKNYLPIISRLGRAVPTLVMTLLISSAAVAENITEAGGIVDGVDIAKSSITILDETLQVDPNVAVMVRGQPVPIMMVLGVGDTVLFKAAGPRGERVIISASVVKGQETLNAHER